MAGKDEEQYQWYTTTVGKCNFTLPTRYQELTSIGQGAFGVVIRARDKKTGEYVAIKKLPRPFLTKTHAKRTYRELKLLTALNHHDAQVVQLYDVFTSANRIQDFNSLYFVFNYVGSDLRRLIQSKRPCAENFIRAVVYQVLKGLKYIHSAGIMHRDLKPENIGIDEDSNVTILDFGLARTETDGIHTGYVATRWWRAPEIFINWERYDEKIDIWSVGCIMAELILLKALFPGKDHLDQLNKIFDIIGTPKLDELHEICTAEPLAYLTKLPRKEPKNFDQLFGYKYDESGTHIISGVSPDGIDLLRRLLSFDPRKRPTVEEALSHPFILPYHSPTDEPVTNAIVDLHGDADYNASQWRSLIWQMIQEFVPPSWIMDDACDDDMSGTTNMN